MVRAMRTPKFSAAVVVNGLSQLILGFAIDERDPRRVMAVGGQRVDVTLLSNNGGVTWQQLSSPGKGLRGAYVCGDELWVVGEYGFVARSDDSGVTWSVVDVGFAGCLFGVTRDAHGTYFIAGDGGFVGASTDGRTFKKVSGASVSLSRLYKTAHGVFIPTDAPGDILQVTSTPKPKITKHAIGAGGDLMAVTRAGNGTMVVVGASGRIYRSTDDGASWTSSTSPTTQLLCGVCALPTGQFVAVGLQGTIVLSDDDGLTFAAAKVPLTSGAFWSCTVVDGHVLVGGENGVIGRLSLVDTDEIPALPASTAVSINGVLVDDAFRAMVYPWRGGTIAVPPAGPASVDDAWAEVRRLFWASDRWLSAHKTRQPHLWTMRYSHKRHERRFAERLHNEQAVPGTHDDNRALVHHAMDDEFYSPVQGRLWDAVADFLVVSVGVVAAVEAAVDSIRGRLPYYWIGVFGRLRDRLMQASDEDYRAVLALALPSLERRAADTGYSAKDRLLGVLSAWSFLLPPGEEPHEVELELQSRAQNTIGSFGDTDVARPALLASCNDDGLRRFFSKNTEIRHEFFAAGERPFLATLLARGSPLLKERLPSMRPRYDSNVDVWASLLARLDDFRTTEVLARERRFDGLALQARLVPERVRDWARRHSDDASLEARLALLPSSVAIPARAPDSSGFVTTLGAPSTYVPPQPLAPPTLVVPAALQLPFELSWRDTEEDEAAARKPYEGNWSCDFDGDRVYLANASPADVDTYVAMREQFQLPTNSELFVLLPTRVHARLAALGAVRGEWSRSYDAALLKNADVVVPLVRAFANGDDELTARLNTIMPLGDVWLVPPVVQAFAGKKDKALARTWIGRHPRHAAAGALAMVHGDVDAVDATRVLRFIDGLGLRDSILRLAAGVDADFAQRITGLLDEDPLLQRGVKVPTLPAYAKPDVLPPLKNADGTSWSTADTEALLVRMAASNPDEVNPVITKARSSLDRAAGAAFARALFEAWLAAGADAKQNFCLHALGYFGDDEAIRRLSTLVRAWPGESAAARAQVGLDTLVLHGSDAALLQLALISEKSKFAALKGGAASRISAIADARGLSPDELADRLVPTFNLDDAATTTLSFGERSFFVTFDENLAPRVKDASGTLLKDLPKPNKSDDAALAKAAKTQLSGLKKDIKTVADLLLRRLERAMIERRLIDADAFVTCFVEHPLTFHVARRVLWEVVDDSGARVALVRLAEDRTFADLSDNAWTAPRGVKFAVVHPIDLDEATLAAAGTIWADYELLQPFAQLGRAVHRFTPTGSVLTVRDGKQAPAPTLVFGLEGRQWRRYDIVDGGAFGNHTRVFGTVRAVVDYDGNVGVGYIEASETLTVRGVSFSSTVTRQALSLAEVSPRILSEVVLDIDAALG